MDRSVRSSVGEEKGLFHLVLFRSDNGSWNPAACIGDDSVLTRTASISAAGGTSHRPSTAHETRVVNGKEVEVHTWYGPDDKDNPYVFFLCNPNPLHSCLTPN